MSDVQSDNGEYFKWTSRRLIVEATSTAVVFGFAVGGLILLKQMGLFFTEGSSLFVYSIGFMLGVGGCLLGGILGRYRELCLQRGKGNAWVIGVTVLASICLAFVASAGLIFANRKGLFVETGHGYTIYYIGAIFGFGACIFWRSIRRHRSRARQRASNA